MTPSAAQRDLLGHMLAKEQVKVEDALTTEVEVAGRPNAAAMTAGAGRGSIAHGDDLFDRRDRRPVEKRPGRFEFGHRRCRATRGQPGSTRRQATSAGKLQPFAADEKRTAPSQFGANVTRRQLLSQALRNSISRTNQALVETAAEEIAEEQVVTNELRQPGRQR